MTKHRQNRNPNHPGDTQAAAPPLSMAAVERAIRLHAAANRRSRPPPREADQAEELLQGLLVECHAILREQVRPAVNAHGEPGDKLTLVRAAAELFRTGALIGDTIGRLRGQAAPEMRQRITVERIQTLPEKP